VETIKFTDELEVTIGKEVTVRCLNTNRLVTGRVTAAFLAGVSARPFFAHVDAPGHVVRPILVRADLVADKKN
jgi:hypothetical protein